MNMRLILNTFVMSVVAAGIAYSAETTGKVTTAAQAAPEAFWIKEGKAGGALKLSGTSYVAAGGLGSFDQLTVAMWVKPTALDYEQQALLHSAGWDTSALHFILLKDGRVQAAVKGAEPVGLYSVATPGKQLGEWTHLALVYDAPGKKLRLFVNGRKDADLALTQAVPVKLDKFRLGAWDQEPRVFNGALDDVRIYRGALDEGAIAGIAGGTNPPGAKLAAHWTMDQAAGTQLADASGEKHPATIVKAELGAIPVSESQIENIIVVYKTHFDIGFTELASTVIHRYRTDFVDRCLKVMESQNNLPPNQRFTWIVPGWPLEKMMEDWEGQTDERKKRLMEALQNNQISPHALSYSTHTGTMDLEELVRSLGPSYRVCQKAGKPLPISGKMTDVPGHTWVLPTVLHAAGIKFMHIGDNDNSAPCQVPPLFWWEGPDGSRVLTVYAPFYTFGIFPPNNWKSKTWLALIMTSDNQGPPSSSQFSNDMKTLSARFPKANIRTGTMDDFARLVMEEKPELPVVSKDLADSWIYGTMSMPQAVIAARQARALVQTADLLEATLAANGVEAFPVPSQAIYDDTARFAEHTWGADYKVFYSEQGPGPRGGAAKHRYGADWQDDMKKYPPKKLMASWEEKGVHAYRAEAASLKAVSENMQRLAASVNVQGDKVVVFNPLPYERDGVVCVDTPGTFSGQLKDLRTGAIVAVKKTDSGFCFLAEGVPASGYVTYVPVKSKARAGRDLAVDEKEQTIENRFFKLRFSPETGSIASIIEKSSGAELVQQNSSYKFGQYLYERFSQKDLERYNSQYIRAGWAHLDHMRSHLPPEVPHLDLPATGLKLAVSKDEISVSGTLSGTPDIASKIPEQYRAGSVYAKRIEIKVTLFSDKPFIDIAWSIDGKQEEPWPEAGWLCFPLKTEKPEYRLGALGCVVNPATDIVAGADSDMASVSEGLAVKDGNSAVVIDPVDSPMVCLGYPKLWYYRKAYETPPESTVFVNLFNNCWGTNFQEWNGGTWSSRIRISRCADYQDGACLKAPSRELRLPLQGIMTSASGGKLPAYGSGITLSRKDVYLTTYGKNPFGEGMILRLWDQSGKDGDCEIIFPKSQTPAALVICDLYSRPTGQTVPVKDGRCRVLIGRNAPASFMLRSGR